MIELTPHLIAITAVLILFLMAVLNLLLYRPILKTLDQRKEIVEGAAQDTEHAEQQIGKLQQDYDHAFQEARSDAKAVYNRNHKEALVKEREILTKAQKKTDKIMEKAMVELEKDLDSAKEDLRSHSELLSREISAKILGRTF